MKNALAMAFVVVAVATIANAAQPAAPINLVVDLSDKTLFVMRGNEHVRNFAISSGSPAHPTPKGSYTIRHLVWNPRWTPPKAKWAKGKRATGPADPNNPMKIVKIFFQEPDYYIHGTANEESLGAAESHGCIRMAPDDAIVLARMLMEESGIHRGDAWFTNIVRKHIPANVRLPRRYALTIRE
jgi:lipoprotein-anchoring transpeptidase ErfK/SrfK